MAEVKTTIDSETGARTHAVTGELSPEDLLGALESTYQRSDYKPGACSLWDLRGAVLHQFTKDEIRRVVDFVMKNRNAPSGTCAAIVVGGSLGFGLARMYEQMLVAESDVQVMVFRDMVEAKAWLKGNRVGCEES
jgi:hypothetical protein